MLLLLGESVTTVDMGEGHALVTEDVLETVTMLEDVIETVTLLAVVLHSVLTADVGTGIKLIGSLLSHDLCCAFV